MGVQLCEYRQFRNHLARKRLCQAGDEWMKPVEKAGSRRLDKSESRKDDEEHNRAATSYQQIGPQTILSRAVEQIGPQSVPQAILSTALEQIGPQSAPQAQWFRREPSGAV